MLTKLGSSCMLFEEGADWNTIEQRHKKQNVMNISGLTCSQDFISEHSDVKFSSLPNCKPMEVN